MGRSDERGVGTIHAGLVTRNRIRAGLDVAGVEWTEHKAAFSSIFVVRTDREGWRKVRDLIWEVNHSA